MSNERMVAETADREAQERLQEAFNQIASLMHQVETLPIQNGTTEALKEWLLELDRSYRSQAESPIFSHASVTNQHAEELGNALVQINYEVEALRKTVKSSEAPQVSEPDKTKDKREQNSELDQFAQIQKMNHTLRLMEAEVARWVKVNPHDSVAKELDQTIKGKLSENLKIVMDKDRKLSSTEIQTMQQAVQKLYEDYMSEMTKRGSATRPTVHAQAKAEAPTEKPAQTSHKGSIRNFLTHLHFNFHLSDKSNVDKVNDKIKKAEGTISAIKNLSSAIRDLEKSQDSPQQLETFKAQLKNQISSLASLLPEIQKDVGKLKEKNQGKFAKEIQKIEDTLKVHAPKVAQTRRP